MNPWLITPRKGTSWFRWEVLHSFLPDSRDGLSFPCLVAPAPFGEGQFVHLTAPQWQRPILDVTEAWCSRARNGEARSHVFGQGSSCLAAGGWGEICSVLLHLRPSAGSRNWAYKGARWDWRDEPVFPIQHVQCARGVLSLALGGLGRHLELCPTWTSCEKWAHFNPGEVKVEASLCLSHSFQR